MKRLIRGVMGIMSVVASLSLLAAICAGCSRPTFAIEPYLQNASPTGMTIRWATSTPGESRLTFGPGTQPDQQSANVSCRPIEYYPNGMGLAPVPPKRVDYLWDARLTGLTPGTAYSYRVTAAGESAGGSFRTSPNKPGPFTFVAYGDSRTGVDIHRQIGAAIGAAHPAFVIHTGDMTDFGAYHLYARQYFEPLRGVMNTAPVWNVYGNHEGDAVPYRQLFDHPSPELWYSFDYGNAHFVALDYHASPKDMPVMLDWLDKDLAASKAEWKMVCYHVPSYDISRRHSTWGRTDVLPILRRHEVDLVVAGDSHSYQRFRPMFTPGENDDHPITHMVAAGGGAPLHSVMPSPFVAVAELKYHFVLITIDGGKLVGRAIGLDGKDLDTFTIDKAGGKFSADYLASAVNERDVDRVRGVVVASMDGAYVPSLPAAGQSVTVSFPVTAGADAIKLKFFPKLAAKDEKSYSMEPVTVRCPANATVQAAVTLKANVAVTVGKNNTLSPAIALECHYEGGKDKGVAYSGPLRVGPPPTTPPAAGSAP